MAMRSMQDGIEQYLEGALSGICLVAFGIEQLLKVTRESNSSSTIAVKSRCVEAGTNCERRIWFGHDKRRRH